MTSIRRPLTIDDPLAVAGCVPRGTLGYRKHSRPAPGPCSRSDPPKPEAAEATLRRELVAGPGGFDPERGALQPIIVRSRKPEGYELIAGERRWRASPDDRAADDPSSSVTSTTTPTPTRSR